MPSALVVDGHPLFAEALAALVKRLEPSWEVATRDNLSQALVHHRKDKTLALAVVGLSSLSREALAAVRELAHLKHAPKVAIVGGEDSQTAVRQAIAGGASAYIAKSSSAELILNALRLVLAGGTYLPPHVLEDEPRSGPRARGLGEAPAFARFGNKRLGNLTDRQRQVLELLAEGWSNQEIAQGLDIALATVKLHVNAILRALDVKNRTQAAGILMRAALEGELESAPAGRKRK